MFPGRNYLQSPEWGWLLVIEMFVAAVAAGSYFAYGTIGIANRKQDRDVAHWLGFVPLPLMLVVAVILIGDLGQPLRFVNLLLTAADATGERGGPFMFNLASPMSVGSYTILVFGLFTLVAFVDSLVHSGNPETSGPLQALAHNPIWQGVGGLFALLTGSYSGVLLNVTQQTVWTDTFLHGALYTAMAALAGMGVAAIIADHRRADSTTLAIRDGMLWIAAINAVLLIVFLISLGEYASVVALSPLIAIPFWIGLVIVGLAVPIFLLYRGATRERVALAGWLTLVGALTSRYVVLFSAAAALHP